VAQTRKQAILPPGHAVARPGKGRRQAREPKQDPEPATEVGADS